MAETNNHRLIEQTFQPATWEQQAYIRASGINRLDDDTTLRQLVEILRSPIDLDQLTQKFDAGDTWVRDIGYLTTRERSQIISLGETTGITTPEQAKLFTDVTKNFATMMREGEKNGLVQAQPGFNFLYNMEGFVQAGYPWAIRLDDCLKDRLGQGVSDIVRYARAQHELRDILHDPLAELAMDPRYQRTFGVYLAHRSLVSEQYQERQYGKQLDVAKTEAIKQVGRIGSMTGLSKRAHDRAVGQIQRTAFSSFDHLLRGVSTGSTGAYGDYYGGTLRVQLHFDSSNGSFELAEDPHSVLQHEVTHVGSAQDEKGGRVGLSVGDKGALICEGLTEFLSQEAQGFPLITINGESIRIAGTCSYKVAVSAIAGLYVDNFPDFAALYNASYGQIDDPRVLERAIGKFQESVASYYR